MGTCNPTRWALQRNGRREGANRARSFSLSCQAPDCWLRCAVLDLALTVTAPPGFSRSRSFPGPVPEVPSRRRWLIEAALGTAEAVEAMKPALAGA